MSSINRFKAPWPSSCNCAKAPPPDRRTLTPKAPSTGYLGSSLATADGTATTSRQAPRPWQGDGNASPLPSQVSSSCTALNFRESRSPQGERLRLPLELAHLQPSPIRMRVGGLEHFRLDEAHIVALLEDHGAIAEALRGRGGALELALAGQVDRLADVARVSLVQAVSD